MPQRLQLQKNAQVMLNAAGEGSATLGPSVYGETWITSIVAVRCTRTNVMDDEPQAKLYLGPASDSNFIGGTYSGSQDADTSMNVVIPTGLFITAKWTGGVAGETATLIVTGIKEIA